MFYDRITGKALNQLPKDKKYVFGQIIQKARLRNNSKESYHWVVPNDRLKATLSVEGSHDIILFEDTLLLSTEEGSFLKSTLQVILEEIQLDFSAEEIIPLIRNFDDRLQLTDFEKFLVDKLFHLEEVSRQPAYSLKRESSKVNVSRAQRIPVRAINYLASHSEDWSHRRIRSVVPRHVLAELIEYDLEIYENKVSKVLIDRLLIYLKNRVDNELIVIEEFLKKYEDLLLDSSDSEIWFKKSEHDFQLLGKIFDNDSLEQGHLNKTKESLQSISNRLYRLLNSRLYQSNSRTRLVTDNLEITNLLRDHEHYRVVREIWFKSLHKDEKSELEIIEENRTVLEAYIAFVVLLVRRSMERIGYRMPPNSKEDFEHKKIKLITGSFKVTECFEISIKINEKSIVLVPLPIFRQVNSCRNNVWFVTLSGESVVGVQCMRLSPNDLHSEDRLSKMLFRSTLEALQDCYHFSLDSQKLSKLKRLKQWMLERDQLVQEKHLEIMLKRAPDPNEIREVGKLLDEERKHLSPNHKIREGQLQEIEHMKIQLDNAIVHFNQFHICIGCGTRIDRPFEWRVNELLYSCSSTSCGASYKIIGSINYRIREEEPTEHLDTLERYGYHYI